ncbi:hypothetical protein [Arenibacterium sp. LLYu02]|uniref:hypothetical protein n=1 Tax=Arenibacterium sp. LLYu02 TaxID=3404132 RepID=UPI003B20BB51
MAWRWWLYLGTLFLLLGCDLAPLDAEVTQIEPLSARLDVASGEGEEIRLEPVTRISQAPYTYRDVPYWTLANGCTYSPALAPQANRRSGWRWYLVSNPLSPRAPMVHEGCTYVFDADQKSP